MEGQEEEPGFACRQDGSRVWRPGEQRTRTLARLLASAVTLMWGLGLVSTLQTQFPLLDDGTAPAPPISGFAYKGQEAD